MSSSGKTPKHQGKQTVGGWGHAWVSFAFTAPLDNVRAPPSPSFTQALFRRPPRRSQLKATVSTTQKSLLLKHLGHAMAQSLKVLMLGRGSRELSRAVGGSESQRPKQRSEPSDAQSHTSPHLRISSHTRWTSVHHEHGVFRGPASRRVGRFAIKRDSETSVAELRGWPCRSPQ